MICLQTLRLGASRLVLCAALSGLAGIAAAQSTVVRVQTNQGNIDVQLLDAEAPRTVANFLAYVRSKAWVDVLVHRSVPGFVIQTGGYKWPASTSSPARITSLGTVVNEFSATRSNLRGTLAMAKVGGNPDSATSEWFVNLSNNAANLDAQNGGFTVFARVSTDGMFTADKIAALPRVNAGGVATEMPVLRLATPLTLEHVLANTVTITAVTEYPAKPGVTDADRIFDHLEKAYPEYTPKEGRQAGLWEGYTYRYYPQGPTYVGIKDNQVWYLVPAIGSDIRRLGSLTDWLVIAATSEP